MTFLSDDEEGIAMEDNVDRKFIQYLSVNMGITSVYFKIKYCYRVAIIY